MSNRHHLPAGQNIPAGGMSNMDMAGPGPGSRRRQQQQQQQQQQQPQYMPQYHHPMNPMYQNYNPYNAPQYYGIPPQYQNGAMPSPGYMPYQGYARSPAMHQYVPMAGVTVPPNYPRPSPHSPGLSTPYQPPPAPAPMPPHTPSSTQSSQIPPPPTPPTPQTREPIPEKPASPTPRAESPQPVTRASFRPPLPWFSRPDLDFPTRTPRSKRRRRPLVQNTQAVSLPTDLHGPSAEAAQDESLDSQSAKVAPSTTTAATTAVSENAKDSIATEATEASVSQRPLATSADQTGAPESQDGAVKPDTETSTNEADGEPTQEEPAPRAAPTSWANLFTKTSGAHASGANGNTNGSGAADGVVGSSFNKSGGNSVAEAIQAFRVQDPVSIPFLEPRGLVNTGNMCYMNSVLQVLMFCVPFYDFLDQVGKRAAHSFKSETPLLDAMIMFMHEFKAIRSGASSDLLQRSLRPDEIERHGDPFTPEFVYEAIRQLSRFDSMRRGHQQDAEEFLGFMLQSLDDECNHVMMNLAANATVAASEASSHDGSADPTSDWLEVGRKQRSAVTRSSGSNTSTPITKIFGGLLRSEFRVPGLKDSITTEPYQPLQLDIGSPDVRNVIDALRGLTRPERLQGDFNSPRGKDVMATKQVFIESLPPVLILHLKRFQFDAEGNGTVKIWKKIGYPLELEIPREALSRQARQSMGDGGMPKYKLISVVYHHGKNASGGHYTVDVRRQDGREWLRLDDTVLRRVRSEDVAQMGSEEDIKDQQRRDNASGGTGTPSNRFGAMNDEDEGDDEGWNEVTASSAGNHKRWSSVANGSTTNGNIKEKHTKENFKDNRVAYLLFYQRM